MNSSTSINEIPSISRRALLKRCGSGFGALALGSLLNAGVGANTHRLARARSVIWLFMDGGPSQIDTWDYKPELMARNGQQLPTADTEVGFFKTSGEILASPYSWKQYGESGTWASDIMRHTAAAHADDMAFVHSCYSNSASHTPAMFDLLTGTPRQGFPGLGSWVAYGLGTENANLPAFVVMQAKGGPKGGPQNWSSGFLPSKYQGALLGKGRFGMDNVVPDKRLTDERQRNQLDLLSQMNATHLRQTGGSNDLLEGRIASFELAYRMQTEAVEVLDIEGESPETRSLYGLDDKVTKPYGELCLRARKMVESGVRFVQIYSGGPGNDAQWDAHKELERNHLQRAAETDLPIAGLLTDLKRRGLLESTLVVCCGEFGRTSDSQGDNGRDHNPQAFTTWFAGGGVQGGVHYGETDEFGYRATVNRVTVHDLHATVLHLLGIDHEALTYRHGGRDFRLTDVEGHVLYPIVA